MQLNSDEYREFLHGIELFNAGEYFEAHEVWEEIWKPSSGAKRELLQGLIQMAVAMEHWKRGNPTGSRKLFVRALGHWAELPDRCLGLHLRQIEGQVAQALFMVLADAFVAPTNAGPATVRIALHPEQLDETTSPG